MLMPPVKFHWIPFVGSREEVENVSANQKLHGHPEFPIFPKNTNLVKDVDTCILLPVRFCWIPFSSFTEVKNVSANQGSGRPSWFSDCPPKKKKYKYGRGLWAFAPVKFGWILFSCCREEVEIWKVNDSGQRLRLRCTKTNGSAWHHTEWHQQKGQSQGHKVIDHGINWKGIINEVSMPYMKSLSLAAQKV